MEQLALFFLSEKKLSSYFNLNARYGLPTNRDEYAYSGGFRWQF